MLILLNKFKIICYYFKFKMLKYYLYVNENIFEKYIKLLQIFSPLKAPTIMWWQLFVWRACIMKIQLFGIVLKVCRLWLEYMRSWSVQCSYKHKVITDRSANLGSWSGVPSLDSSALIFFSFFFNENLINL